MSDSYNETLVHSGKDFDLIKAGRNLRLSNNGETVALVDADLVYFRDELERSIEVPDIGRFLFIFIGYCPKESIIFNELSVEEHLLYYAAIKGIPRVDINYIISDLLNDVHLLDKKDQLALSLSQLNKRKLMVAIANLSKPTLLLMNEPIGLSGSKKKFKLWSIVKRIAKKVVFVSHYLDEVKKYSTTVGAVTETGGVEYLGLLKENYSDDILINDLPQEDVKERISTEITFKLKNNSKSEEVTKKLENQNIKCEILKEGVRTVTIKVNMGNKIILFEAMEDLKDIITGYNISYRSLH